MKLKLEWFNPECLSSSDQEPTPADLAVKELNSVLLNDWWKLDKESGELWLRDFTFKRLAPELEDKIVNVLNAMDAKTNQIDAAKQQLQKLLEWLPQS